jgi:hypothetical protein
MWNGLSSSWLLLFFGRESPWVCRASLIFGRQQGPVVKAE